ncbi:MAG: hypothetical protein HFJ08_01805 [Lachnospiraceae bacterium]|nr:hypothetical protein [Lachnospiraceae bacterium]
MEVYNKNRDQNNSMHDEIREQNAKLKDAPFKEKLAYFKEYYLKMTLVAVAAIGLIVYILVTTLTSPSDTAFAAYFYNDTGDISDTALIDGFIEYAQIDTKKHNAYIDTTVNYYTDGAGYDIYIGLEKTMAVITTQELDIIIGDDKTIDYFAAGECYSDITKQLPSDLLEQFQDRLYYAKVGETDEAIPVGIYVTDAPKLQEHQYYVNMEPILSFVTNSNSMDNAILFLRYLYETD